MIGYNRTVKLRWLDETVDLFLSGMSDGEIYEALRERLSEELSVGSSAQRGSREKTITLLLKTWVRVPLPLQALRQDGMVLLTGVPRKERLPLHWGMTMAAYPFWRVVAEVTGRLFRLQGTASPLQVQRRVKELFGEREAVARSARYVLRAFADWGVIHDGVSKGEYVPAAPIRQDDPKVATWLLEAAVVSAAQGTSDYRALLDSPCLFPFQLQRIAPVQLTESGRLEIVRHGVDEVIIRSLKA